MDTITSESSTAQLLDLPIGIDSDSANIDIQQLSDRELDAFVSGGRAESYSKYSKSVAFGVRG